MLRLKRELMCFCSRWEEKDVAEMKKRRDRLSKELTELGRTKKKQQTLENLKSQIKGIATRLNYARQDSKMEQQKLKKLEKSELVKEIRLLVKC